MTRTCRTPCYAASGRRLASPDDRYCSTTSPPKPAANRAETVAKIPDAGLEIDAEAYGEDWEGFKEMVIASDIKDKNLILQVLSMYDSSAQRESEIKNMASVFDELKTGILPKLRRSMIVNSTDLQGKTDEEMMALVNQNKLGDLTQEELLFVAESVAKDNAVRAQVLEYAAQKYNVRACNNLVSFTPR
ncbi:MAG: hypothetical protein ACLS37_13270 [Alistipes sp.]